MNQRKCNPNPHTAAPAARSLRGAGLRGAVIAVLRAGEVAASNPSRWIRATPVANP